MGAGFTHNNQQFLKTDMNKVQHLITFAPDGTARCLWTEAVPLHELGRLDVQRASTVEFEPSTQLWEVRLASNPEVIAFSHASRAVCLDWERKFLVDAKTQDALRMRPPA